MLGDAATDQDATSVSSSSDFIEFHQNDRQDGKFAEKEKTFLLRVLYVRVLRDTSLLTWERIGRILCGSGMTYQGRLGTESVLGKYMLLRRAP